MSVGELEKPKRRRGRPPTGVDGTASVRLRKPVYDEVSRIAKDRNLPIAEVLSSIVSDALYDSKIVPG